MTSAASASERTVRAPTPGVSRSSAKSAGPRSAAAASAPCSRRSTTSPARTSWRPGSCRCGSAAARAHRRHALAIGAAADQLDLGGPGRPRPGDRSGCTISPPGRPSMAACGSSTNEVSPSERQWYRRALPRLLVHPLLHHHPGPVVGHHEGVQVELVAVLDRGAVHLGHQPAGARQRRAVEPGPLAEGDQLLGRAPRVPAAPAAHLEAQLALQRRQAPLQRARPRWW